MATENYNRLKEGFRFQFDGIKTNASADAIPPTKFPYAQNIRGRNDKSVRTRPGTTLKFMTGSNPTTDIRAYDALLTDNLPRYLTRDSGDLIWLDNGVSVGTLATATPASPGAALIPFRPNNSPNPWMYVANGTDYQKFSSPTSANVVTQQKTGIAELQQPPDAAVVQQYQSIISQNPGPYTHAGTAGAVTGGTRITDTVGAVFPDPNSANDYLSFIVSAAVQYQRGMGILINSNGPVIVQDVFPPLANAIGIAAIYYYIGTTGRCVVVPQNLGASPGNEGTSIYTQTLLNVLRRGAIVAFAGGTAENARVLDVTTGPDGTICFEVSTNFNHTTAETITTKPAIAVIPNIGFSTGQSISTPDVTFQVTAGVGSITSGAGSVTGAFFSQANLSFQPEDYIHFSVNIDNLLNLVEMQILFDVGDGSFTENFYYYAIRPSDIIAALASTSVVPTATQIAVAQTLTQRQQIQQEISSEEGGPGVTNVGGETSPGSSQWTEIFFPISALIRVGNDQTKTLQNTNALQYFFQAITGPINVAMSYTTLTGGFQPDVGDVGAPYLYRVRPRSSLTGVRGNPSPASRYGVNPRRQQVKVTPYVNSGSFFDPQTDYLDIFRYGGSITSWRFIGTIAIGAGFFYDNFSDDAVNAGEALDFDNFEPWPTVDLPLTTTASVVGTTAVVTAPTPNNILRWLPGTLVRIGGINVYTLWTRPTLLVASPGSSTYLFQFVENAATGGGVNPAPILIQEPYLANQMLPYMWGPDASGTVFACGDPLRPGTLYFSKNYNPDSAPDSYNQEIVQPGEPLMGGCIIDGLSHVASTERWWTLYPGSNPYATFQLQAGVATSSRYNAVQEPLPRGVSSPYGIATNGIERFWWAKDGIYSSVRGSLTDADLYNLFPHEGVAGADVTYEEQVVHAPSYQSAGSFRLTYSNNYLYAVYIAFESSVGSFYCMLTCDLRRMAWSVDVYVSPVTAMYHPEQQASTLLSSTARYDELVMAVIGQSSLGVNRSAVVVQTDMTNDYNPGIPAGSPIIGNIATFEFDGGDIRAGKEWGDAYIDITPQGSQVSVTPLSLGSGTGSSSIIPTSTTRTQIPVSLGGDVLKDFLGLLVQWVDNFAMQANPTTIHAWQFSFLSKPETIADRFTDWDDAGLEGAKWFQGFILHADTFNAVKSLAIRDSDTLALHPFTPAVQQNGESEVAYSFVTPFIAHTVRIEPQDQVLWRFFDARYIAEQTPEIAETWQTQLTSHGQLGFMHVRQMSIMYASTAPVTLTISVYDGTAPQPITLPATAGVVSKIVFVPTFNKGQLFAYKFQSAIPFQLYQERSEVLIGRWGRADAYSNIPLAGGKEGDHALI